MAARSVEFVDNSPQVLALFKQAKDQALRAAGEFWRQEVDRLIVEQNIIDTGALRESMGYDVDGEAHALTMGVTPGFTRYGRIPEEYALENEFGTHNRPARPFLKPSAEITANNMAHTFGKYFGILNT